MPDPENPPRLFLSYTRKDSAAVKELYQKLKQAGYHPWMDIEDILPGQDWEQVMIHAINNAAFFLACLSTNSVDHRGVVQQEIKHALQVWRRKLDDDVYFIPVRLDECKVPDTLAKFNWVDLFLDHGFGRLLVAIRAQMERLGYVQKIVLRSRPAANLSEEAVVTMLQEKDFFDIYKNWMGKGIKHQYEAMKRNGAELVVDHTTSLMWQQSGSALAMNYAEVEEYLDKLNGQEFAGYSDWRLPTLEEAMSLVEPKKNEQGSFSNPLFDKTQARGEENLKAVVTRLQNLGEESTAAWVAERLVNVIRQYKVSYGFTSLAIDADQLFAWSKPKVTTASEPENSPRLFLSYTRKDRANVKELYQKLKQTGYPPLQKHSH